MAYQWNDGNVFGGGASQGDEWNDGDVFGGATEDKPAASFGDRAEGSDFVAGAQAGWESLKSLAYGAKAAFGQATGNEEMQRTGIEQMQAHEDTAGEFGQGRITRYEDVAGVGDFVDYAQYTLGQLTPFALESAATAITGAVVGTSAGPVGTIAGGVAGLTAKTAVKEAIKKYVRKEVMDDAEKALAKNALAKAGGTIGAVMGSYPVAVGDVYNETVKAGDPSAGTAFAAAIPYTALDVIPEVRGIRKILDGTKGGVASRVAKTAITQAPMEAAAETGQEEILIRARAALDPTYDVSGEEANSRRLNSAIGGALGGAAFGGVAGLSSNQERPELAPKPEDADPSIPAIPVVEASNIDEAIAAATAAAESTPPPSGIISQAMRPPSAAPRSGAINLDVPPDTGVPVEGYGTDVLGRGASGAEIPSAPFAPGSEVTPNVMPAGRGNTTPPTAPPAVPAPAQLESLGPDPLIAFPDGSVARKGEVEALIASKEASGDVQGAANLRAHLAGYPGEVGQDQPASLSQTADVGKKNGKPFASMKEAELAMKWRKDVDLSGYQPVAVNGGYMLRSVAQNTPPESATSVPAGQDQQPLQASTAQASEGTGPPAGPVYADPRLKRDSYRAWLQNTVDNDMTPGGGLGVAPVQGWVRGESEGGEVPLKRLPSVNPKWVQSVLSETGLSVDQVRNAVSKAIAGKRLGVGQERAVKAVLDQISGERAAPENMDYARGELEKARALRRQAKLEASGDWLLDDAEYAPELDGTGRAMLEMADEARALGLSDQVEALLDSSRSDDDIASALATLIAENTDGRASETGTQEVAGGQGQGPHAEAQSGVTPEERQALTEDRRQEARPVAKSKEQRHGERRQDAALREHIATLSDDEKAQEIVNAYTDELTGLGNRRAWNKAEKLVYVASLDLDSLKFINDTLGHPAGDEAIKALGHALGAETDEAYHISGDEFIVQADTRVGLKAIMTKAAAALESVKIIGQGHTKTGIEFSFGIGKTIKEAELGLKVNKKAKPNRGAEPPGVTQDSEPTQTPADAGVSASDATSMEDWWQKELTTEGRLRAMARAKITKVPGVILWNHMQPRHQEALQQLRDSGWNADAGAPNTAIDAAAHEAATSPKNDKPQPTDEQKKAGNYAKGHVLLHGLDISVENPKGSERSGIDANGKPWSVTMAHHYGYFKGTIGKDKDHIDVFLGPDAENASLPVFVIDQIKPGNGHFDEAKVMLGFHDKAAAEAGYKANYAKGWNGIGDINGTSLDDFKNWLKSGDTKQPFADWIKNDSGATRQALSAGVPSVATDERAMPQPTQQAVSAVRGEGDNGLQEVANELPVVPGRRGTEAISGNETGTQEQQQGLQTEQRSVGNAEGANPKSQEQHLPGTQRTEETIGGVGGGIEGNKAVPVREIPARAESGRDTGAPEGREVLEEQKGSAGKPTLVESGEQLYSKSGRKLAVAPKIDSTTSRKINATTKRMNAWLLDEAKKEATGDSYLSTLLSGINLANISPADQDTLNEVLFGDADGPTAENRKPSAAAPTAPLSPEAQAKADFDAAMAELGDILTNKTSLQAVPIDTAKMLPVLTKVMDAAIRMGYYKFKKAAKFVLDTIRDKLGNDAANAITIDHLQAAYIGIAGSHPNADSKKDVIAVDTLKDLEAGNGDLFDNNPGDDQGTGTAGEIPADAGERGTGGADGAVPGTSDSGQNSGGQRGARKGGSKRSGGRNASDEHGGTDGAGDRSGFDSGRAEPSIRGANYRITDADNLGGGGPLEKARANIQAIRIIKALESEHRGATPDEQAQLVKYTGWGASELANKLFPSKAEPTGSWKDLHDELRTLLTDDELTTAARSTQYAHYTSKPIIDGIYDAISGFGFQSGLAVEGGAGTGNFIGLIPSALNVHYTGIEMDGISAKIAAALYPESGVIGGDFTKIALPQNHFDLAIGNPPYASIVVSNDQRYKKNKFLLHDYFIAKQIDSVRPGGLAVFVTSKGTMDKQSAAARDYLSARANLLGAIRLPQTAFKASAGTEVVTDILFFQKRGEGVTSTGQAWSDLREITTPDGPATINEYFAKNPKMILGESRLTGSMYRENEYTVVPTGDIQVQIRDAIAKLPKGMYHGNLSVDEMEAKRKEFEVDPRKKEASYYLDDAGNVRVVQDGVGVRVAVRGGEQRTGVTKAQAQILRDYIPLRDAVMAVYRAQMMDGDWKSAQIKLHGAYDRFVKAHGPINQVKVIKRKDGLEIVTEPVLGVFDMDPEAYRVAGIEHYDEATNTGKKGAIFSENIISRQKTAEIVSATDALNVTLNDLGYVDLDYLVEKYGQSREATLTELGTAVFMDPATDRYATGDDYLSGNVKAKLVIAKDAAEQDSQYQKNVEALDAVQPEDLPIARIPVNLGAHWIPASIVQDFAETTLGFTGKVTSFIRGENSNWSVDGKTDSQTFGTDRMTADEILSAALNRRTIKIYDIGRVDGKEVRTINTPETAAANQKAQELKEAFASWAVADEKSADIIHEVYNRKLNTTVPRKFNGDHLTLPRLSSRYKPHNWQSNVVWRILQRGNTYMAHTVGSGKTLAANIAGMEMRRLGIAKKPGYAVLKSTLKQFATEFLDAYPDAKILVADEKKLDKDNRRRFMAQVANEDWDAVIFTHQSFEKIPLSEEFLRAHIEHELAEYRAMLETIDEQDRAARKTIERQIEAMEKRLESMTNQLASDAGFSFEELGIDFLFVDEAHHHKKIPFPTNQSNIKGVSAEGSGIALDLYLKSKYLNTLRPGRNLVLMSGTPVTNTMGEVFNIQRYLQPDVLEQNMVSSFDAWSATFADSITSLEMQANGAFKPSTRLAKFVGVPGLLRDFLQVADIVTDDHLKSQVSIKRPVVVGGSREIVAVPRSEEMKAYQAALGVRIKALEQKKGPPKKGEDNILVVIGDGKKASIDMRLVGGHQSVPSKLDVMIDSVYQIWNDTKGDDYSRKGAKDLRKGSTQLIFTEIVQSHGFNVYDHIRDELVKRGVPTNEIAFIQEATNSNKKKKLFRDMNNGVKRVMIGGSKNMGTGVNVQQRLKALHHLDIDYLPANIVQREGRGIRQGNQNSEVAIRAYVTEGTIDAFMWQLNETKQRMIDQVMNGDLSIDSVEDVSDSADQMAAAKALASGNPLLLEQAGLHAEVKKLESLRAAHLNQQFSNRDKIKRLTAHIPKMRDQLEEMSAISKKYQPTAGEAFSMTILGHTYNERKAAGEKMIALGLSMADVKGNSSKASGNIGGYDFYFADNYGFKKFSLYTGRDLLNADGHVMFNGGAMSINDGLKEADPVGVIRQMENKARELSNVHSPLTNQIAIAEKKLANLQNETGGDFKYQSDLDQKRKRLDDINGALVGNNVDAAALTGTVEVKSMADFEAVLADVRARPATVDTLSAATLRERLERVAAKLYGTGAKTKGRRIDIVIGGPGTGKTTSAVKPLADEHGSLIVDSDDAKRELPEFDHGLGSNAVHQESSIIARRIMAKALNAGDNIVFSTIGKSLSTLKSTIETAREQGYDVHVTLVDVPTSEAINRAIKRFYETKQFVDPAFIAKVSDAPAATLDALLDEGVLDERQFSVISNDVPLGEAPRTLYAHGGVPGENFRETAGAGVRSGRGRGPRVRRLTGRIGEREAGQPGINGRRPPLSGTLSAINEPASGGFSDSEAGPFSGIAEQADRDAMLDPRADEARSVQTGIEGKTPQDAARFIIKHGSKANATIAERVLLQLGRLERAGVKLDMKIAHLGDSVPRILTQSRGVTDYKFAKDNNRITVWLNGADVTGKVGVSHETLLHELVHMATVGIVHLGNLKAAAGTKSAEDVSDLYAITNHVIKHFNQRVADFKAGKARLTDFENRMYQRATNAFADADETLAWGLSNPEAQAYLESIPYQQHQSAWSAFVSAIRKLLGIPARAETALSEVLRVAENIMSDNVNEILGLDTVDGQSAAIQSASGSGMLPQRNAAPGPAGIESTLFDELRFKAQDKFHYLNKVQKAAAAEMGVTDLPEAEDAYLAELRYHGMAGAAIDDFQREHVDPLLKVISESGTGMEDVDLYLQARHAREANAQLERINPDRPDNTALSGMSNQEAAAILARLDSPALRDIGARVDAITAARREKLVDAGLETQDTVDKWEAAYQHYVPLKREGHGSSMPRRGKGFDTRGKEKRRAGSNAEVVHVLANVVAQYEATAIKAEKVKVGKAFLAFATAHPDAALYEVDKVSYQPSFDSEGLVTYRADRGFVMADNVLVVRENGEDRRVTFNENSPVAMRIAHALNNLGATETGPIVNILSKLTRWLAIVNTGANPEFVISNFARDLQTAGYNLSATEADGLKWKIIKDVGKAWRGIRSFQKQSGVPHAWAQHFDEYRKAGAQTGWMDHYNDIAAREKALVDRVREMSNDSTGLKVRRGLNAVIKFIEDENTAVENAIRLSAFVHARRAGLTEAQAAKIAKEMTVNFNRKGDMGQVLNALYLFYNASIQGSVRILQAGVRSKKVQLMMGATVVFAAALDILNRAMGGDDDDDKARYDKIPDFVKERNLIIMNPSGDGDYIKIPLPWGYNVFHVMGQVAGEAMTKRGFHAVGGAGRVAAATLSAFNPIGGQGSLLQSISPTITDPLVQWAENKDWSGKPLRPASNPFGVDKPDSQKYWGSVRAPSKWLTDELNSLTGGDEVRPGAIDISPEAVDLMIDTFTGGAGRFVTDTLATPMKALQGEPVETYEVPLLRKLYGTPGAGEVVSTFYESTDTVSLADKQYRHYKGDAAKQAEIRAEHDKELRLVPAMKEATKQLRALRKIIKLAEKAGNAEKVKLLRAKEQVIMKKFNTIYSKKMFQDEY